MLTKTKSKKPRTIAIDPETARRWRLMKANRDEAYRTNFGSDLPANSYVFAQDLLGSRPIRPGRISRHWRLLCTSATAGADIEFRGLRRWHATVLDNDFGHSLEWIGRRLGHTQIRSGNQVTQRYVSTSLARDRQMADEVASRVSQVEALMGLSSPDQVSPNCQPTRPALSLEQTVNCDPRISGLAPHVND